jgi:hypothetical protein
MRLIYFNTNAPDYVYDSLLHGLRRILGNDCVDVCRNDSLYSPLPTSIKEKLGNNGFFIYGLLQDNDELKGRRFFWERDADLYDAFVVTDIWRHWNLFWYLFKKYPTKKIAIVDGHDISSIFPYKNIKERFRASPRSFFTPVCKVKYFKRELHEGVYNYNVEKFFSSSWNKIFSTPKNLYSISMSIPKEKITRVKPHEKINTFVSYIVDEELKTALGNSTEIINDKQHLFTDEYGYIKDIQKSKFGPTVKRAGWDCLRHYEYASQGTVLCFKNLDNKPPRCAPHGLNNQNTIVYKDAIELLGIINNMSKDKYLSLYNETYKWIENNTTEAVAKRFLDELCS